MNGWGSGPDGWPSNDEVEAAVTAAAEVASAKQATATSVTSSGDSNGADNPDTESAFIMKGCDISNAGHSKVILLCGTYRS